MADTWNADSADVPKRERNDASVALKDGVSIQLEPRRSVKKWDHDRCTLLGECVVEETGARRQSESERASNAYDDAILSQ